MARGSKGRILIDEDFTGPHHLLALTVDQGNFGQYFEIGGEGIEDTDAGATRQDTDGLGGVVRLVSANGADQDTTFLFTGIMFDVGLMGGINIEARVRLPDLDEKQVFFGLTDINTFDLQLEVDILDGASGTTLTKVASDYVGFHLSTQLTDDEDWHGVYNGGTTTGPTDTTTMDLDSDAIAGEWQEFLLELGVDGSARWWVDGVLKQSVSGAVSLTTDMAFVFCAGATTTEIAQVDIDYIRVESGRDWTK